MNDADIMALIFSFHYYLPNILYYNKTISSIWLIHVIEIESIVNQSNARDCKMVAKIHLLETDCRIKKGKIDSYHKQEQRKYSCHVCFEVICIIQYSLDIYHFAPCNFPRFRLCNKCKNYFTICSFSCVYTQVSVSEQ